METNPITAFATEYLHEDWQDDYDDLSGLLEAFVEESDVADQRALGLALSELLATQPNEDALERALRALDWQVFFEDVLTSTMIRQISNLLRND